MRFIASPAGLLHRASIVRLQGGNLKAVRLPNVRLWLLADIQQPSELRLLYPRKRTFRDLPKITFFIFCRMSAFGGKADLNHGLAERPLLAKTGHSAPYLARSAHSHKRT